MASMGNTEIRDIRSTRRPVRGDQDCDYGNDYGDYYTMDGDAMSPMSWDDATQALPGMADLEGPQGAFNVEDIEAKIIEKAMMDQEVAEAEAEWGWRPYNSPYQSPWNPRPVRLQLDKVLPASSNMPSEAYDAFGAASSSVGDLQDGEADDGPDPMSLLPTLLSPGAASPRSDDDKGSTGNVDSFFSGDPLASLFNAGR